jgi:hypothetical protein
MCTVLVSFVSFLKISAGKAVFSSGCKLNDIYILEDKPVEQPVY